MNGIEIYGIVSICLFVAVFTIALVVAAFMKKPFLTAMSSLPLNDGDSTSAKPQKSHE